MPDNDPVNNDNPLDRHLKAAAPNLSTEAMANLRKWLTDEAFGEFRADIVSKIDQRAWQELEDSFYTTLPFGTGGRRGPRGIGPNRINRRTIAESARGLAGWVEKCRGSGRDGIVIAFDTRHGSTEYSRVCAQVIAASGGRGFLFDGFRATPELSFAVRYLRAAAGIVVSASHNPPTDNGFKAYASDGGQLVPPDDAAVMSEVEKAGTGAIPLMDLEEGRRAGRINIVGPEIDQAYQDALARVPLTANRDVRIVFSPLHGVGGSSVLPALRRAGFRDIHIVEEQSTPDGDFPNVADHIPNPEIPSALIQSKQLAERVHADIALASDPDADRVGCVVKRVRDGRAEWMPMTGNQMGALLTYFILDERKKSGRLREDSLVVKTTVTTELVSRIAKHFDVGLIPNLLVGFKFIACVAEHIDDPDRLVFATEESHGYLSGAYTRDKDGACAALLLAEAAAKMKVEGRDLWGLLNDLYRRFGYFHERLENYLRPGKTGQHEIHAMIDDLRNNPPRSIAGLPVMEITDRLTDEIRSPDGTVLRPMPPISDPKNGRVFQRLTLAKDNLLLFALEGNSDADGASVAVRPSGTEPKCKFYVAANKSVPETASDTEHNRARDRIEKMTQAIRDDIMRQALGRIS